MQQTGGRLPKDGVYGEYPFAETLNYACVAVFKLSEGENYLGQFDKDKLCFMSPVKRERENTGRINLKAGQSYVIVPATEKAGRKGRLYLSIYFNQQLRDVEIKRVFHPLDKNSSRDEVLPSFIPEEAEKMVEQTPLWKIKLV